MKLLLVIPRYNLTNKVDYNYSFPLGLGYISAVIKKAGYKLDCINLNHIDGTINKILTKKLNSKKYDFVLTGNNALGYSIIETIFDTVKKHPSKPKMILGGPIITSEPEVVFNALNPDVGVTGEGEETILELLKTFESKKSINNIKGIIYRKGGKVIMAKPRKPVENLDSLPFPDFEGFEFEEQIKHINCNYIYHGNFFDYPRILPLLASRSCPFRCTFCYHDSKYRKRSISNVMKEINTMVKKYKINTILVYDECFALDNQRLLDFCKKIKKLRNSISWELKWTCQLRVENIDPKILETMKEAGCEAISYGFESFSPKVLKSMNKNISPQQIDRAIKETMKAKISCQGLFIFGDTAETKETALKTLNYWKKNCKGQIGLGFIQPYPGSEIYKRCVKKGIIKDKLYFIKNKISQIGSRGLWLNMTYNMTDEEIRWLRKEILDSTSKYFKFIKPISIKKEFKNHYLVELICPFCGAKLKYGNCLIKSKISFGFLLVCRDCHKRFFVVSPLQKVGYRYYPIVRKLRDLHRNIQDSIKKKMMKS